MRSAEVAAAVQAVEHGLRRGVGAIGPRHRTRYLTVTALLAVAVGACFDIPASLWSIGAILRFPLPMVIVAIWTLYTRSAWRARPRWSGFGRQFLLTVIAVHVGCFGAATVVGTSLQHAGIPLPFTLAGVTYVALWALIITAAGRRAVSWYTEQTRKERW